VPQLSLPSKGLHVRVHGPADGPAVLLLHGYPLDGAMWRAQLNPLAGAGFRLVVPDLPGHGQSPVQDPCTIADMTDAVVAEMDRLKLHKAHVVAFSMGGYVALDLAIRHPERVGRLALLDTRAEADTAQGRDGRMALLKEMVGKAGVKVLCNQMMPGLLTPETRAQRPLLAEEVRNMMMRQPIEGERAAMMALADRGDRRKELGHIKAKTLVLVGEHDKITPPASAQVIADGIPGAKLEAIPGAAHLSPLENPEAVNRHLLAFLGHH
jgi:pimeloyl-ACP methyl ester carboxylesterase